MKEPNKFLNFLFELRDTTHVLHLQTSNYNDHKVLNEFYDGILEQADCFAEQYQGITGETISNIGTIVIKETVDPISYLKDAYGIITEHHKDCEYINVKIVLETILQLIAKTLYLLKLE